MNKYSNLGLLFRVATMLMLKWASDWREEEIKRRLAARKSKIHQTPNWQWWQQLSKRNCDRADGKFCSCRKACHECNRKCKRCICWKSLRLTKHRLQSVTTCEKPFACQHMKLCVKACDITQENFLWDMDFTILRHFSKPPVRAVIPISGGMMLGGRGQILGPYLPEEWFDHHWWCLDKYFETLEIKPTSWTEPLFEHTTYAPGGNVDTIFNTKLSTKNWE